MTAPDPTADVYTILADTLAEQAAWNERFPLFAEIAGREITRLRELAAEHERDAAIGRAIAHYDEVIRANGAEHAVAYDDTGDVFWEALECATDAGDDVGFDSGDGWRSSELGATFAEAVRAYQARLRAELEASR